MLLDADSFSEHDANMVSVDTLKFTGMASYTDRLKSYQKKTGLKDAVITGLGKIDGQPRRDRGHGFQFHRRHHGLGRRRKAHPPRRARHAANGCR